MKRRYRTLRLQEFIRVDSRLFQDRSQRALGHVAWMIRDCCVPIRPGIEPDFVAAGGLAVELEAARFQLPNKFSVPESRQTSHSRGDDDRVVSAVISGRQIRDAAALASCLDQFSSDVARNFERLGYGPALGHQAGEFIGGCEKQSFWQLLDLYPNRQLHTT